MKNYLLCIFASVWGICTNLNAEIRPEPMSAAGMGKLYFSAGMNLGARFYSKSGLLNFKLPENVTMAQFVPSSRGVFEDKESLGASVYVGVHMPYYLRLEVGADYAKIYGWPEECCMRHLTALVRCRAALPLDDVFFLGPAVELGYSGVLSQQGVQREDFVLGCGITAGWNLMKCLMLSLNAMVDSYAFEDFSLCARIMLTYQIP